MKKIIPLFITLLCLISCNSTKVENYTYDENDYYDSEESFSEEVIQPEKSDDFLGDYNAIALNELMFLVKSKNEVKPKQISKIYLVPRSNTVEISFRDVLNEITISFNKAERNKIINTCNLFLEQYESRTVPHHKVNSKTAYLRSTVRVWYGVVNATVECSKNDYFINCEFINKKPYLLIRLTPTRCDKKDEFTPKASLYLSPSQVRDFIKTLDQEYLNSFVEEYNTKAYTY